MAPLVPAVPIKKSVTPDYIISLEDGRKFKSMKRYLGLRNMTPAEYREKWGLPRDYPMVAPNYAAARSELAKKSGLGRKASGTYCSRQGKAESGRKGQVIISLCVLLSGSHYSVLAANRRISGAWLRKNC